MHDMYSAGHILLIVSCFKSYHGTITVVPILRIAKWYLQYRHNSEGGALLHNPLHQWVSRTRELVLIWYKLLYEYLCMNVAGVWIPSGSANGTHRRRRHTFIVNWSFPVVWQSQTRACSKKKQNYSYHMELFIPFSNHTSAQPFGVSSCTLWRCSLFRTYIHQSGH